MIRYAIPLALAATVAMPAHAQVEVEIASQGPVVALSVSETVTMDPDIANLSAGVTTRALTAVDAMQENARAMSRVIAAIEELGVDEDDIQTSGVQLNPDYEYNQSTREQEFRGYRVANRVSITVRDIDEVGPVLDRLVSVGATDIGGIGWDVDDPAPAIDQARTTAFATARERAGNYARMAGYSDIRLLQVAENVASRPRPMEGIVLTGSRIQADSAPSTPVRPGQVQAGVTVNFTYEMVR
ncbi:SIMPL domain-containing protein [Aurantiacibacter aquimixticola]|uniref:DUF541 domain-containing protein n=1 Tax=Aurantiacibacter aquimixticola TaxID=1958945 RepID=A0A419RR82_9SPHN|nr:SIMPL domain-containing protein [Aurantiacibacter aquimixticola]RJY08313.1 DUF541 domain-containing protein [Aurantiacibacter aquimixticola]